MPDHTIPLSEKYRPSKLSEIKGQEIALDKVKAYVSAFTRGINSKRAILLYGPAGTGKTTIAHAIAKELSYEIFELNSSDLRNRAKLEEVLKPSTLQKSLFSKGKIILVDEVDGVTTTDYGGLAELIALIEKTKFPMIITCNDLWQNKFSMLRSKCELVPLKEIAYAVILDYLKEIAKKEKRELNEQVFKEIAAKSRGDLRAALNDLQSVLYIEESQIIQKEVDMREKSQDIFNALREIFKARVNKNTLEIYDTVDLEMDQINLWLEENIPSEYRGEDLARAFEALSKADIYKGRIHRQQHWRFMVYQNFFLSAGIAAAKGNKNLIDRFTKYNPPKRILKIWMINQKNSQKKSVAGKFAELTHTSKKRALLDFNIISLLIDKEAYKTLDLTEQEQEYLVAKRQEILHSLGKIAI
jgi:replication factor C large subunit